MIPENSEKKEICQWYISYDPEKRVRKTDNTFFLTEKSLGTLEREEKEHEIPEKEALFLISESGRKPVEKTRYVFPFGKLTGELDVYKGELYGLCVCEFEFDSTEEAFSNELPEWLGKEVTDDPSFRNAFLSKKINGEINYK